MMQEVKFEPISEAIIKALEGGHKVYAIEKPNGEKGYLLCGYSNTKGERVIYFYPHPINLDAISNEIDLINSQLYQQETKEFLLRRVKEGFVQGEEA